MDPTAPSADLLRSLVLHARRAGVPATEDTPPAELLAAIDPHPLAPYRLTLAAGAILGLLIRYARAPAGPDTSGRGAPSTDHSL